MPIEDLRREDHLEGSSDRVFGLVFSVFFAVIGLGPLRHHAPVRVWALVVGALFLTLALAWPSSLTRLNRLWMRVGLLLSRIVSPIASGIVFFLGVFPTGLIMRLLGKDTLRLRLDPEAETYWIARVPPGPDPRTMTDQF